MRIYELKIVMHDFLFYSSREIGYLWETIPVIHNYALTYALGFCKSNYHSPNPQIPLYDKHLSEVNCRKLYVTPAMISFAESGAQISDTQGWSFGFNGEKYHLKMAQREQTAKNNPLIGRNKVISPEVAFTAFLISQEHNNVKIPQWIRLGKWDSKAEVTVKEQRFTLDEGKFDCQIYLNPLDIPQKCKMLSYDVLNMPPVSLIKRLTAEAKYIKLENNIILPNNLSYHIVET